MIIQHNLLSLTSGRQLKNNTKKTQRISEQLNSGFQINRAADDAAGLTISEKMRIQIRGLHQAVHDLKDGISYVQTADSALSEVQDMLHRINELTIKSLNDTNTPDDRQAIDYEVQSLKTEIDRIFKTTEFNARKIWDETADNPVPTGRVTREPAIKDNGHLPNMDITQGNKTYIPKQSNSNSGHYSLAADDEGIIVSWTDCNNKNWVSEKIKWAENEDWKGSHSFNLADHLTNTPPNSNNGLTDAQFEELKKINNFKYSWTVNKAATKEDMIKGINGRTISYYTSTPEYIDKLNDNQITSASIPSNVDFRVDLYYDTLLRSEKNFDADDDGFIKATQRANLVVNPAKTGNGNDVWTFEFDMNKIGKVQAVSYNADYSCSSGSDDYENIWWEWKKYTDGTRYKSTIHYGAGTGSWDNIKKAMETGNPNFVDNCSHTGTIGIDFRLKDSANNQIGTMHMSISVGGKDTLASLQTELQKLTGLDIEAKDGSTGKSYSYVSTSSSRNMIDIPEMGYRYGLNIQSSGQAFDSIKLVYESMNLATLNLDTCSVDTRAKANETLEKTAKALNMVSDQRSLFGSYQNRMEYAVAAAENTGENVQASESRIRDTDMADAVQQLSVSRILSQASQAMLAQANLIPSRIAQLLS